MEIKTKAEFIENLQSKYEWPGMYPRYFVTHDGQALSYDAAREHQELICAAIDDGVGSSDWSVVGVEVNWDENDLVCAHSGEPIECAYPPDTEADTARQSPFYRRALMTLDDMETMGGPEPSEYVWVMLEIAREALKRANVCRRTHLA